MKVVKQSAELLSITPNAMRLIEQAGRVCYKSEEKMKCVCEDGCSVCNKRTIAFVQKIIASGHESVIEHASASILFITDRGMTHELVRHRLCAYSQESTRYCNYGNNDGGITVIQPVAKNGLDHPGGMDAWKQAMAESESSYLRLLGMGWPPQWARSVLPTCLKTEIVTTANFREWRHIFKLRATNPRAHPQIRDLIGKALLILKYKAPAIFGDIEFG